MLNRVNPKKSLGQNFLCDKNISRKIVSSLALTKDDFVVEIGPGQGALTELLIKETDKFLAIEIDSRCVKILNEKFGDGVEVLNKDFLELSIPLIQKKYKNKIKFVGNIPYNITSQILFHIFENANVVKSFTAMMQKEVASRLIAKPKTKEYGILSVMTQYYSNPKILFDVSKNCFFPKPKVTSSVVEIDFQFSKTKKAIDEKLFKNLVRKTFNTRRKTLRNGLKNLNLPDTVLSLAKDFLDLRPEELSPNDFVLLSNKLSENGIALNA